MKKLSIVFALALIIGVSLCLLPQPNVSAVEAVTYDGLIAFLEQDDISGRKGNPITYNCANRALDLWHNAYSSGLDAFIVLLNEDGLNWHCRVGFYAENDVEPSYLDSNYTCFWGTNRTWFYVEATSDCVLTRAISDNPSDETIIALIPSRECLRLWAMANSVLPRMALWQMALTYKISRLI